MNTVVIYESNTGFTAQYAQWLVQALACEARPLKGLSQKELAGYERVVFGGWVMAGNISGLGKLRGLCPSPAAVFAVGSAPPRAEVAAQLAAQNKLKDLPFFYLEGGFRFQQLALPQRLLLKGLQKALAKKADRDPQEEFMAQVLGTSYDHADQAQLRPLMDYLLEGSH